MHMNGYYRLRGEQLHGDVANVRSPGYAGDLFIVGDSLDQTIYFSPLASDMDRCQAYFEHLDRQRYSEYSPEIRPSYEEAVMAFFDESNTLNSPSFARPFVPQPEEDMIDLPNGRRVPRSWATFDTPAPILSAAISTSRLVRHLSRPHSISPSTQRRPWRDESWEIEDFEFYSDVYESDYQYSDLTDRDRFCICAAMEYLSRYSDWTGEQIEEAWGNIDNADLAGKTEEEIRNIFESWLENNQREDD